MVLPTRRSIRSHLGRWVTFGITLSAAQAACAHRQPRCVSHPVPPGRAAPPPEALHATVHATHPHDPDAFTEGLVWSEGSVYEGTGIDGQSAVRRTALESGALRMTSLLGGCDFGEGIAVRGDALYELTWDTHRVAVWDLADFSRRATLDLPGYGWGLAHDAGTDRFLVSDGSPTLTWRAPSDFHELAHFEVVREGATQCNLNEIELAGGSVWANIYSSDHPEIVRIDPATGQVTGVANLGELAHENAAGPEREVNGIAWVPERQRFLVTGKRWSNLYEVTFDPVPSS